MSLWLGLVVAAAVGALATGAMRTFARRVGFVNQPNAIVPQHTEAVAYGGGVGVAVGAAAGAAVVGGPAALLVACLAMVALGVLDDAVDLAPSRKLLGQMVPAAILATSYAPSLTGVWALDMALAGFWVLVLVNAVNLTDVCDGLVGGMGAIALAALGALTGEPLLLVTAASLVGFLLWNRPPASIYLGDAGSMLLGLLAAYGSLQLLADGPGAAVAAVLVPGAFLFELVFLVVIRVRKGLPWWRGSPDHFSLRLQAGPFSRWQTVLIGWGSTGILAALGWAAVHHGGGAAVVASALAVGLAAVAWRGLLRWEVPPREA